MAGESLKQNNVILRHAFRSSYENLGLTITVSVMWFLLAAVPAAYMMYFLLVVMAGGKLNILLPVVLLWATVTFIYGPVTTAVYAVARDMLDNVEVTLSSLWKGFTANYKAAAKVTGVMTLIILVLIVDVIVYLQSSSWLVLFLTVILIYLMVFWFLMSLYIYPLILHKYTSVWQTLKQAALLTLDNVVVTLLVALEMLVLALACIFFVLPVPAYLGGITALLHSSALKQILYKYEK